MEVNDLDAELLLVNLVSSSVALLGGLAGTLSGWRSSGLDTSCPQKSAFITLEGKQEEFRAREIL